MNTYNFPVRTRVFFLTQMLQSHANTDFDFLVMKILTLFKIFSHEILCVYLFPRNKLAKVTLEVIKK